LRALFNYTIYTESFSGRNPVTRVKLHRERFLLSAEVEAFIKALEAEPQFWRDYFLLLLLTGLRRSALVGLHWDRLI
jgi:integrase